MLEAIAEADHHLSQLAELPVTLAASLVEPPGSMDFEFVVILDLELSVRPIVTSIASGPEIRSSRFDVDLPKWFLILQGLGGPHAEASHEEKLLSF